MFISWVTVIKLSKLAFFVFSADDSKNLATVWAKYLSAPEISWVLSESEMTDRIWSYHLRDIMGRNIKKLLSQELILEILYFQGLTSCYGSSEPNNPQHFLKELNKIFQMHLNILLKLWLNFCCHHQKIQMRHFGHFNDHNPSSKQDI